MGGAFFGPELTLLDDRTVKASGFVLILLD